MTDALRLTFDVDCPADHAFEVWTSRIDTWWPRDHTVGEVVSVSLVGGLGGRIYERDTDGTEHEWGRITAWDPPRRLAYRWHIGRGADEATDVEVRFVALGPGATRVEIEQDGWERFGDRAGAWRDRNHLGWDSVLPHFRSAIERSA